MIFVEIPNETDVSKTEFLIAKSGNNVQDILHFQDSGYSFAQETGKLFYLDRPVDIVENLVFSELKVFSKDYVFLLTKNHVIYKGNAMRISIPGERSSFRYLFGGFCKTDRMLIYKEKILMKRRARSCQFPENPVGVGGSKKYLITQNLLFYKGNIVDTFRKRSKYFAKFLDQDEYYLRTSHCLFYKGKKVYKVKESMKMYVPLKSQKYLFVSSSDGTRGCVMLNGEIFLKFSGDYIYCKLIRSNESRGRNLSKSIYEYKITPKFDGDCRFEDLPYGYAIMHGHIVLYKGSVVRTLSPKERIWAFPVQGKPYFVCGRSLFSSGKKVGYFGVWDYKELSDGVNLQSIENSEYVTSGTSVWYGDTQTREILSYYQGSLCYLGGEFLYYECREGESKVFFKGEHISDTDLEINYEIEDTYVEKKHDLLCLHYVNWREKSKFRLYYWGLINDWISSKIVDGIFERQCVVWSRKTHENYTREYQELVMFLLLCSHHATKNYIPGDVMIYGVLPFVSELDVFLGERKKQIEKGFAKGTNSILENEELLIERLCDPTIWELNDYDYDYDDFHYERCWEIRKRNDEIRSRYLDFDYPLQHGSDYDGEQYEDIVPIRFSWNDEKRYTSKRRKQQKMKNKWKKKKRK